MLYSHLHHHSASQRHNIKDRRRNEGRMIKTHEGRHKKTSLEKYSPLTLLQGFERVVEGLHVIGCWRPNINFIFWPHFYDRHVVSCLPDVGVNSIGAFRGPPRSVVAFPTTSGLYYLEVCWQMLRGFPMSPSVGGGLPNHISSLTLWESAGNCSGTQTQLS